MKYFKYKVFEWQCITQYHKLKTGWYDDFLNLVKTLVI